MSTHSTQSLLDRFSKRSQEIRAYLAATGTPTDPAGRQTHVLRVETA